VIKSEGVRFFNHSDVTELNITQVLGIRGGSAKENRPPTMVDLSCLRYVDIFMPPEQWLIVLPRRIGHYLA
jgi:hypothetical protein